MSYRSELAVQVAAAVAKGTPDPLTDLRDRLIRDQAVLMERKVAAYNAGDTTREAHLDGQIAGLGVALRYIAEGVRS